MIILLCLHLLGQPRRANMRILSCTDYYLPHVGGVEVAAANLYYELAELGHEITVLCLGEGHSNHERITVRTASQVDLTDYLHLQSSVSLEFPRMFLSEARSGQYDLLHLHNRFFFTSTVAALLSPIVSLPVVFSLHTSQIEAYSGISGVAAEMFDASVGKYTVSTADYVICNSRATARKAQTLGVDPNSLSIQHHGVDTELFAPREEQAPDTLSITYVGRLVKNKGVRSLPRIFAAVKEEVTDARLHIVGDGPLDERLRDALAPFGADVTFHGELSHVEVARVLQRSTVFCLPSKSEGLSLTTLEAMATGLPVVVSDTGGLQEIVQDGVTGFRLPPSDPDAFADTILSLWGDPHRRAAIGAQARTYAKANHSWTSRARAVDAIFQEFDTEQDRATTDRTEASQ